MGEFYILYASLLSLKTDKVSYKQVNERYKAEVCNSNVCVLSIERDMLYVLQAVW